MLLQKNRFLSEFSTFGIGGPIQLFAEIATVEEMEEAFAWARKENMPVLILGKGSNCLFSDRGFQGLALLNKIHFCEWSGDAVYVGAGFHFSLLGAQAARRGLSGLEFASGIPATVGGAVFMNAGANGRETADSLLTVSYLHAAGGVQEYAREQLDFRYRSSPFQSMQGAILAARFQLHPCMEARKKQLAILDRRIRSQPLKEKSAGCIFRNPGADLTAGALIDGCGLKGTRVGQAKVSEVHANFIVNDGGARASDVRELIRTVQEAVAGQTGVQLEPEIRIYE